MQFVGPRSFTGEDAFEVLIPGGRSIVSRVQRAMLQVSGVRLAGPGEFSARAYLHGRLTLAQAEGLAARIAATHADELDHATAYLEGHTGLKVQSWADEVTTLLALIEAGIDFTDQEDVRAIETDELLARLSRLREAIADELGPRSPRQHTDDAPLVVLLGPPNAGKSTLFNALVGHRFGMPRAIVSPIAGTTRDAIIEPVDLPTSIGSPLRILLCDLPGLEAEGAREGLDADAQTLARLTLGQAAMILHCDPLGQFDRSVMHLPAAIADVPTVHVRTKADRGTHLSPTSGKTPVVAVCALDGWNLDAVRECIVDHVLGREGRATSAVLERHRHALERADLALASACELGAESERVGLERLAHELRRAASALGEIVGRIDPDEVIGVIFSRFCVGK